MTEPLRSTEKKSVGYLGSALVDTGRSEDPVPGWCHRPNLRMVGLGSPHGVGRPHEPVKQAKRSLSTLSVLARCSSWRTRKQVIEVDRGLERAQHSKINLFRSVGQVLLLISCGHSRKRPAGDWLMQRGAIRCCAQAAAHEIQVSRYPPRPLPGRQLLDQRPQIGLSRCPSQGEVRPVRPILHRQVAATSCGRCRSG
jgi:hypothetical protein